MGLKAIYRRPRTSKPAPGNKIYPYLLTALKITRPNQVWAADITYIPMARGFLVPGGHHGLVQPVCAVLAVIQYPGCRLLCRGSEEKHSGKGRPEIFNTDQGSQFTGEEFTGLLEHQGIKVSMDGKGSYNDNLFIERLWRTVKYEEVYLKAYQDGREARIELGKYFRFYNTERPHQAWGTGHRPRNISPTEW